MFATDWGAVLRRVALEILGEPNVRLSTRWEWRYGRRGSLSLDLRTGRWYSHQDAVGGGVLEFVERVRSCTRDEAVRWLREAGHTEGRARPQGPPSPAPVQAAKRLPPSSAIVPALVAASQCADGTQAHRYLHARGVWPTWAPGLDVALPADVRWLPASCAPAPVRSARWPGLPSWAAGALLAVRRSVVTGEVQAVELEALDAAWWGPSGRWRRLFGPGQGAVFEARAGAGTLHVAEGVTDALALVWAPWARAGRIVSAGGTSGLAGLRTGDVQALVGSVQAVVLHPDSDPDGEGEEAAAKAQALIQAVGVACRVRRCPAGLDPAEEVAAWLRTQASHNRSCV